MPTMIPRTEISTASLPAPIAADPPVGGWRRSLRQAVSSVDELLSLLELGRGRVPGADLLTSDFPLRVPRGFVRRMRKGDPADPLLLQVLPRAEERLEVEGFVDDPLDEDRAAVVPGLLHKYHGRVLVMASGACGVHCRYCFRRHFPYHEHQAWGHGWGRTVEYLKSQPSVEEVILSGGDPLAASDDRLSELVTEIAAIPHVHRLRIHSRMPIVLPERVDDDLLGWLGSTRLRTVVVVHANHGREIDGEVAAALRRLSACGATLLNQSVLLRGVNDRVDVLLDLSQKLFASGVMPYYLHLMDRVRGGAHFEVDEQTAEDLVWELMQQVSGYLVPRLIREVPGVGAKLPLDPAGRTRMERSHRSHC